MKKWIADHRRELFVGIVVWGITTLMSFVGKWLFETAPTLGNSIIDTLNNIVYTIAATTTDDFFSELIFIEFIGIITGSALYSILRGISTQRAVNRIEKEIANISEDGLKEIEEQLNRDLSLPKEVKIKNTIHEGKQLKIPLIVLTLLLIFLYIFSIFFIFYPTTIKGKFKRDITMIYPYVEETTIHELQSKWVCMRSKSDYDNLYLYIDQVQIDNSLPKQR